MNPWCPLSITYDQAALVIDLLKINHSEWGSQSEAGVDQILGGNWSVIPLLSPYSDANRTDPGLPGE